MVLVLMVAIPAPVATTKLKFANPPPFPCVVLQFCSVTLVNVRLALPLVPVSNSIQPPSPSLPCVPRLWPFCRAWLALHAFGIGEGGRGSPVLLTVSVGSGPGILADGGVWSCGGVTSPSRPSAFPRIGGAARGGPP